MGKSEHPCMTCGACCAFFRVQFYWREANPDDSDSPVPLTLVEDLDSRYRGMKGTLQKHRPRCMALLGRVGTQALCSIYSNRPSPCRRFQASFENGSRNERCDEARRAYGLRPLTREDFRKIAGEPCEKSLDTSSENQKENPISL